MLNDFQVKLAMLTVLAVAIAAVTVLAAKPPMLSRGRVTSRPGGSVAIGLAVMAVALIVVGIVSDTTLRHLIQIAPTVAALGLLLRGSRLGVSAAAPLFAFWLLTWPRSGRFLLGITRIFTGTFMAADVTLTIVIGVGSALGLAAAWRRGATVPWAARVGSVIGFALMQVAAMWLGMQPFVPRW